MKTVRIGSIGIGASHPLALIAGPCVIEDRTACLALARRLARLAEREGIPLVFKASYDKANRSALASFRGPGLRRGLEILAEVRETFGLPVLTDVHQVEDVAPVARVVDVLQIPAFLCRQTDLLTAAGESGCVVNVKKGQFMAPEDMANVVGKLRATGNQRILLTERGVSFGYHNLVVDMRGLAVMRAMGCPVVFDATHSVQHPGGGGDRTTGDRAMAPVLARAAVAAGCDAVFIETYVRPDEAPSDGANAMPVSGLGPVWRKLRAIAEAVGT